MSNRTFLGKIRTVAGGVESLSVVLLVASSPEAAQALLISTCRAYRGEDEYVQEQPDGGFANDAAVVYPYSLVEVSLSSFLELSAAGFRVEVDTNCTRPTAADLGDIKAGAKGVTRHLHRLKVAVSYSQVLDALAASLGAKSWQVLKAKQGSNVPADLLAELLAAATDVAEQSDSSGCSDDLTVTSACAVSRLAAAVSVSAVKKR